MYQDESKAFSSGALFGVVVTGIVFLVLEIFFEH